ncbi:MAG TPA: hypothetical protein VMG08_11075 [Allosphingosinicella sp.]|nr:hypothetical protein [Allosphingosinicella sp.]
MRHFAAIGLMMLALAGCHSLPAVVRIELDGTTLEFKKEPPAPEDSAPETNSGTDAPTP